MTDGQLSLSFDDVAAPLPDRRARDRIATDLATTLFVEAGAGSGKTHSLVGRILALVLNGTSLANIAAITFTEKAAAELRTRVREELDAQQPSSPAIERALHELDGAAIATLHAFAQRLLSEHPIEAQLPPGVEVLDELGSQIDFDDRWEELFPRLLSDPEHEAALLVAKAVGVGEGDLRSLARELEANWDLLHTWTDATLPEFDLDVGPLITACRELAAAAAESTDENDALALRLGEVGAYADELAGVGGDAGTADPALRLAAVAEALAINVGLTSGSAQAYSRLGVKRNWPAGRQDELFEAMFVAAQRRDTLNEQLQAWCLRGLTAALANAVVVAAEERRRAGRLQFHDLLVYARRLLADPDTGPSVRRAVRDRYHLLLIDEFQDTDPIQMELAALIATDPDHPEAGLEPGRIFFVGDPKQSIYRFRRADIGVYLDAQHAVGTHNTVALFTNFRATAPILDWVNRVFHHLIKPSERRQPEFRALASRRHAQPMGPGVAVLGGEPIGAGSAGELRRAEAQGIVGAIATILEEEWTVDDPPRPAQLGDICLLLPTRTSLPTIERELQGAGIAYRAETANLVFASQEIRDLLMVARAIDDPTDELAVVAALRSVAFGCGDDDLYVYRSQFGGGWDHQSPLPAALPDDHPVAESMRWLHAASSEAAWRSPSEMLDKIIRERRLLELAVVDGRQREIWRRLRFVVDQARAWTDTTGGGGLRGFLRWARLQGSESSRVAETVLPETDADAVRILTVHGAKGLEFPITILAGLTTEVGGARRGVQVLWSESGRAPEVAIRAGVRTPDFATLAPLNEEMDDFELRRLLYVACTRARDHLVVSLCRKPESSGARVKTTYAELLAAADAITDAVRVIDRPEGPAPAAAVGARGDASPVPDLATWRAARAVALDRSAHSGTVSATTLARSAAEAAAAIGPDDVIEAGLAKGPRDLDLPPWQKGRYGTAIGRAVHGVLQSVDLASGEGLTALVASQAAAEGVFGHEATIERMVANALSSPLIAGAASSPHWRELFVAAPVGARLLEGYIDLLYRGPGGLVIVDYKTDAYLDHTDLAHKVARYRIQMAAYAIAVEATTGETVSDATLVFLAGNRAVTAPITDLRDAIVEAIAALPHARHGGEAVLE